MRTNPPYPSAQYGGTVRLLVLASGAWGCAAVDLESGALVRAHFAEPAAEPLQAYDVIDAEPADDDRSAFAPDSLVVAGAPRRTGHLSGRRVERYLRPLLHPPDQHLLGSAGVAVPYWTLRADSPSVAIVTPSAGPAVERTGEGLRCRFRWRRLDYALPLDDPGLASALSHPAAGCLSARTLPRALGWAPQRLLVALTRPHRGHCYKVVAGMLARP